MVRTLHERFWTKVRIAGPRECWEWIGSKTLKGYGQLTEPGSSKIGGTRRLLLAHRVAWLLATGLDAGELFVCHSCDNPSCVNPRHLWLGTTTDNMADMVAKGRQRAPLGEAHGQAKLTEAAVLAIRTSALSDSILARQFSVATETIRRARARKNWRHV